MAEYHHPHHAMIMAAAMAHSNMGFGKPGTGEYDNARGWFWNTHAIQCGISIETAVQWVIGYRAENEEHIDMFNEEAKSWEDFCKNADNITNAHADMWLWYQKTYLSERWKHAEVCMNGASNQRVVSRCLHEAIRDVQDEGGNLKEDGAVIMIHHQLSHLLGSPLIMDLALYSRLETEIKDKSVQYITLTQKPKKAA